MLERNMFLFGAVDLMENSVTDTINQLQQIQNARVKVAYEKYTACTYYSLSVTLIMILCNYLKSLIVFLVHDRLFDSTSIEKYIHMDLVSSTTPIICK